MLFTFPGQDLAGLEPIGFDGGSQHSAHKNGASSNQVTQEFAANTAAAALVHTPEDWKGNADLAEWLRSRAQYVRDVGPHDDQARP